MAKEKIEKEVKQNVDVVASKSEQFFEKNKKLIFGILAAVVIVGLLVLAYSHFIYQPKCSEAQGQMVAAENSFAAGEYELSLNGDGNVLGFAQIIEDYGAKAGDDVYYYAGVAAYQTGKFQEAVDYLAKYKGSDAILLARAKACMGDAYVCLGEDSYEKAVSCYKEAVSAADNEFAAGYLIKEGTVLEKLGKKDAALECYKTAKEKYPRSIDAMDIDRYISAIEVGE